MKSVLVTGASGFLGRNLIGRLHADGYTVAGSIRRPSSLLPATVRTHLVDVENPQDSWVPALSGVDTVVHCAARVHVMLDKSTNPLAEFRKANVEATLRLARESAAAGVRRFIFVSSIKVNGEQTLPGAPYTADDIPQPTDPYGISKLEAEAGLLALAETVDMDVVIIRPVLVYGPGVKANFLSLMTWLSRGVPLPLGAIHNKRSLVALDNLCDLIVTCVDHPAASNQVFLVSDGEDLSTTSLLRRMAHALNAQARLLPVPVSVLRFGSLLIGKPELSQRLCGSLQVDITKTRTLLGWTPPVSVNTALAATAKHYLNPSKL
jgi:UDP-4-keto-D-QuiNAc 4-reductase